MRPNVIAALDWIENYGDRDGDGFVEYRSRSDTGIRNQGWKDSHDSVSFRDGRLVEPPIALSEVQGYVYDAQVRMAEYFTLLGDDARAARVSASAQTLRDRYNQAFWMPDEMFYAMALGPEKEQVRSVGSNVGHNLWSDIIPGRPTRPSCK